MSCRKLFYQLEASWSQNKQAQELIALLCSVLLAGIGVGYVAWHMVAAPVTA